MKRITVFGASDCKNDSIDYDNAKQFGFLCGQASFSLVSGGYEGVMEAVFAGSESFCTEKIAVISSFFADRKANKFATKVIVSDQYIERMQKLIDLGDAYIIFPGGPGTLNELSAVWTLQARKAFDKPIIAIGEQWHEIIQLMNYYSEKSMESAHNILLVDNYKDAFNALKERI
jgi:uncharacterized protein (TIGR00730 family)